MDHSSIILINSYSPNFVYICEHYDWSSDHFPTMLEALIKGVYFVVLFPLFYFCFEKNEWKVFLLTLHKGALSSSIGLFRTIELLIILDIVYAWVVFFFFFFKVIYIFCPLLQHRVLFRKLLWILAFLKVTIKVRVQILHWIKVKSNFQQPTQWEIFLHADLLLCHYYRKDKVKFLLHYLFNVLYIPYSLPFQRL